MITANEAKRTLVASEGDRFSNVATVSLMALLANRTPRDTATTSEDTALRIDLLANDTDTQTPMATDSCGRSPPARHTSARTT